jgi:large subunit ribosomal protein L13
VKSFSIKHSEITKNWLLIDAEGQVLGRLASEVSMILRGKNKSTYTPHMDDGDNVIIINAEKVKLTGNKLTKDGKIYYRHTGFPGGIKNDTAKEILSGKYPERLVQMAVQRMLPGNKLAHQLMGNLYVYPSVAHPHDAQKPIKHNIVTKKYNSK